MELDTVNEKILLKESFGSPKIYSYDDIASVRGTYQGEAPYLVINMRDVHKPQYKIPFVIPNKMNEWMARLEAAVGMTPFR
jgi:hypothetical protein